MQNQERGIALFCLFGDCKNLALLGDYCREHQFQRAEAAEACAAQLQFDLNEAMVNIKVMAEHNAKTSSERDEARRQLTEAQKTIDVLAKAVVAQDMTLRKFEQSGEDIADYRAEIERLHNAMITPPHIQQALNESDGVYRP